MPNEITKTDIMILVFILAIILVPPQIGEWNRKRVNNLYRSYPNMICVVTDIDYSDSYSLMNSYTYQVITFNDTYVLKSLNGHSEVLKIGDIVTVWYQGNTWYRIRRIKE